MRHPLSTPLLLPDNHNTQASVNNPRPPESTVGLQTPLGKVLPRESKGQKGRKMGSTAQFGAAELINFINFDMNLLTFKPRGQEHHVLHVSYIIAPSSYWIFASN